MPIVRVIYSGKVEESVLLKLHHKLPGIVARELSTPDSALDDDSIELIFEAGHQFNRGKDLKILVNGNDLPKRVENIQQRSERIANKIDSELLSFPTKDFHHLQGFVYLTLQSGGLGKFAFHNS